MQSIKLNVKFFINFLISGPNEPQVYPNPTSSEEKKPQYWIEKGLTRL
ncbi:hypothetical protein VP01_290g8 [Puccinia sorghi]|uniref:Uncharacterized protein n=1 Tax=Puccinia sorghi TaxID=27349 RepID=A0A0L6V252_9BASI|nr:hypothetical protein VP01_290g8 [Puccinia sorghi]